jgi:cell wall-associated NlpC family hydrolase
MAAYTYRPPRKYRYRRRGKLTDRQALAIAAAVVVAAAATGSKAVAHHGTPPAGVIAAGTAAAAIGYARAQLGKPYQWGGTGPDSFDCSGLVMMAYRAAGVGIERTSQEQWATETHIPASRVQAGDLVFFAGSDGTTASPGHVGIVVSPAAHTMIDAYASGFPVEYDTYGEPGSKEGLADPVGFASPQGGTAAIGAVPVTSGSEGAFIRATLADLAAPASHADVTSLASWFPHEYPSWPPWAANNPMSSTLPAPGSTAYDSAGVQNYPSATEGAQATAETLADGYYPLIVADLKSGSGLCGNPSLAGEFLTWSGNGYSGVC